MKPSQSAVEADVKAAVHRILRDWVDPSQEATSRFMASVRPSFTGYGTGPGDYYASRDDLRAMVDREHAAHSYPFTVDVPWLTVHALDETAAVAVGEIIVTVQMEEEDVVERPRFTFALKREDGQWLLAHFHFSVPDEMQREGDTMDDLLTERTRQLNEEVARQTASLNQALADLKAAQARLIQQEKMASLGQLTAGIAHEIKNPLNFVTNFAGLSSDLIRDLDGETDPDERADLLDDLKSNVERIEAHGRRADSIVRAMMAHARSGGGDHRRVDVNALVEEYSDLAWHGLKARHPHARLSLKRALEDSAGDIEVVPSEIGRVLINLLDNAFDAVDGADDPVVTVSTHRGDGTVLIRVADSGTGMSEAVRAKVFDPFFTTKPTGEGTGLGLSLSHDIVVHGHGGALEVESVEGEGATFVLSLPAA